MSKFEQKLNKVFYINEKEDYQGHHEAPDSTNGKPIYDLTDVYPDDIYSSNGARYYGHGEPRIDNLSISIISSLRGKPNTSVKIYRAVPDVPSIPEQIADLEYQKKYIMKHGKIPKDAIASAKGMDRSSYYDSISDKLEHLKKLPQQELKKIDTINPGDWVTINRNYAKDHGESALLGKYRIITKVVKAKDIYTNGDSIHEWGYDPK